MCEYSDDDSDGENDADLYFRAHAAVKQDNKDEFVGLINRLLSNDKKAMIIDICTFDSANCLAAILDGVAGQSLITYYLSDVEENMPLHYAASSSTPRIASLLLDKGFSADLRTDFDEIKSVGRSESPHVCLKNALPLNVSLEDARLHLSMFEGWKSSIHQIITLCRSMASHPKTIRVIAQNTTEIKHEFFKYLKQGKVVEVGALLAIASDLVMSSSSTIDGENGSIGFKDIMEMRQFLLAEMSPSLKGASSNTQLMDLKKTLRLLEVFDRVGDKLLSHMPMWNDYSSDSESGVASLIEDAAYDEKAEVEFDHVPVSRACCTALPYPGSETSSTYVVKSTPLYYSGGHFDYCTRKFSTKVHFPSRLEEGSYHVDVPLPLPTIVKGAVTKHVLSNKHAPFIGAFAKAVRHLRYR